MFSFSFFFFGIENENENKKQIQTRFSLMGPIKIGSKIHYIFKGTAIEFLSTTLSQFI